MHVHYRPADDVLDYLQKVDFVAVVGPTAVGKNSVVEDAAKLSSDIHWVPFTTSRSPRPSEKSGVEYQFRSRREMEERIQRSEYVNVAPNLLGDLYASAPEDYSQEGITTAAVLADVIATFRSLPFKSLKIIFILPPNWSEWQKRIEKHGFTPEQLQKRMSEAQRSLEFALHDKDIQFIINDDLSQAAQDFIVLVHNKKLSNKLKQDQQLAIEVASNLLRNLL